MREQELLEDLVEVVVLRQEALIVQLQPLEDVEQLVKEMMVELVKHHKSLHLF